MPQPETLRGKNVLVVEDDEDTREVLTMGLELAGAHVVSVSAAQDALRALDLRVPDVIVSDLGLPDEDGLTLMRAIRKRPAEQGGRVPAVAVTAYTLVDDARETIRAGFQRHFRKPVDSGALFDTMAQLAALGTVERRAEPRSISPVEDDDPARYRM